MQEPQLRLTGETLTITEDARADFSKIFLDTEYSDEVC